jgi:hypothetical protein
MRFLSPRIHGYFDYLYVVAFVAGPSIFGFSGLPATLCYIFAVPALVLPIITDFPLGLVPLVPLKFHIVAEPIQSTVLALLPWILRFADNHGARNFYVADGALIFVVAWITEYKSLERKTA